MTRTNLVGLSLVLGLVAAGAAEAKQWKYGGLHPRTGRPDGGMCHIEVVHVHPAAPVHAEVMYRQLDGLYIFIGDPSPFGYEGPRHAFYGHHPVVLDVLVGREEPPQPEVEYCYHDGPHYHAYEPPPEQRFVEKEDVHYYAGEYPREYEQDRPRGAQVNVVYRTWEHPRPVVTVAPPPEYHGPVVQIGFRVPGVEVTIGNAPAVHRETVIVHQPAPVVVHEHVHVKHKHKKFKHKKFKGRD